MKNSWNWQGHKRPVDKHLVSNQFLGQNFDFWSKKKRQLFVPNQLTDYNFFLHIWPSICTGGCKKLAKQHNWCLKVQVKKCGLQVTGFDIGCVLQEVYPLCSNIYNRHLNEFAFLFTYRQICFKET